MIIFHFIILIIIFNSILINAKNDEGKDTSLNLPSTSFDSQNILSERNGGNKISLNNRFLYRLKINYCI